MATPQSFSASEIREIAKWQKWILRIVVANILIMLGVVMIAAASGNPEQGVGVAAGGLIQVTSCALSIVAIFLIFRLARALRQIPWIYAIAAIFPCIGLISLLVLNHFATTTLRAHGVKVGLLGANEADLAHLPDNDTPPPMG